MSSCHAHPAANVNCTLRPPPCADSPMSPGPQPSVGAGHRTGRAGAAAGWSSLEAVRWKRASSGRMTFRRLPDRSGENPATLVRSAEASWNVARLCDSATVTRSPLVVRLASGVSRGGPARPALAGRPVQLGHRSAEDRTPCHASPPNQSGPAPSGATPEYEPGACRL